MEKFQLAKNNLLVPGSQGDFASPNYSIFHTKIADFGLYYFILKEKTKNTTSGRRYQVGLH